MIEDALAVTIVALLAAEIVLVVVSLWKANRFIRNLKTYFPAVWTDLDKPEPVWARAGWSYDPTIFNFIRSGDYLKLSNPQVVAEARSINSLYKIELSLFLVLAAMIITAIVISNNG